MRWRERNREKSRSFHSIIYYYIFVREIFISEKNIYFLVWSRTGVWFEVRMRMCWSNKNWEKTFFRNIFVVFEWDSTWVGFSKLGNILVLWGIPFYLVVFLGSSEWDCPDLNSWIRFSRIFFLTFFKLCRFIQISTTF